MTGRPNLILIMTDQQRFDTIAGLGYPHMVTPALDALSAKAVRFRQAYCPGATCVASRAAIFTGQYAHNTGAYTFADWGHHRTWVQDLAEAGYWCVNIGKMHLQPRDVSGGFHERIVVENPTSVSTWGGHGEDAWGRHLAYHDEVRPNHRHRSDPGWRDKFQGVPWHLPPHLHSDVFIADSTLAWLKTWEGDRPLFLQVGFTGPHEPWDPMAEDLAVYDGIELPDPVTFPEDLSNKPPQHRAMQAFHAGVDHESCIDMPHATLEDIRTMRRHYFAKISLVDRQIARVVQALEHKGLLQNSLFLFCSDHGELLGEHGMAYKWLMYDDIVRVPFLAVPGPDFQGVLPRDCDDLVSLIDIGPTFLEAAGLEVPRRLEGRSLLGLLRGQPQQPPREMVFCEDNYLLMARTKTHKLVLYLGQEFGEFYDLTADPGETTNLWESPDYSELKNHFKLAALEWVASSVYLYAGSKCHQPDLIPRWPQAGPPTLHGPVFPHSIQP